MVWFQCDGCGDSVKKPKLAGHLSSCRSSRTVSCIDCGVRFSAKDAHTHTQCISEAEKYGPKSQQQNGANGSTKGSVNGAALAGAPNRLGLSTRPPWHCSLCNVSATSEETLLAHASGKKHTNKAKAAQRAQDAQPAETTVSSQQEEAANEPAKSSPQVTHKRKQEEAAHGANGNVTGTVEVKATVQSEQTQVTEIVTDVAVKRKKQKKKQQEEITITVHTENGSGEHQNGADEQSLPEKLKWRRLITAELKQAPEKEMKLKALKRKVLAVAVQQLQGDSVDEEQLAATFDEKVNSCSKFVVEGNCVRLAAAS
eukprot:jgi/Chlat1/280/Chrsp1S03058